MIASVVSPSISTSFVESDPTMPQAVVSQGDQALNVNRSSCYQVDQQVKLLHLQAETDALLHHMELLKQRKHFQAVGNALLIQSSCNLGMVDGFS